MHDVFCGARSGADLDDRAFRHLAGAKGSCQSPLATHTGTDSSADEFEGFLRRIRCFVSRQVNTVIVAAGGDVLSHREQLRRTLAEVRYMIAENQLWLCVLSEISRVQALSRMRWRVHGLVSGSGPESRSDHESVGSRLQLPENPCRALSGSFTYFSLR